MRPPPFRERTVRDRVAPGLPSLLALLFLGPVPVPAEQPAASSGAPPHRVEVGFFGAPPSLHTGPHARETRAAASLLATAYDRSLAVPVDVQLVSHPCGETRLEREGSRAVGELRVVLCQEMVGGIRESIRTAGLEGAARDTALAAALLLAYAHGVGEGLVDLRTVAAETAPGAAGSGRALRGDELVALTFEGLPRHAAFLARRWPRLDEGGGGASDAEAAEAVRRLREHGLTERRWRRVLCLLHGADPKATRWLEREGYLGERRGNGECEEEHRRVRRRWEAGPLFAALALPPAPPIGRLAFEDGETRLRTPRWGEATGLTDGYPIRTGDVAALLIPPLSAARAGDLPGEVFAAYAPSRDQFDVGVFGPPVNRERAAEVLRRYRRMLGREIVPALRRSLGPTAVAGDFRLFYFAMKDEPDLIHRLEPVPGSGF